MDDYIYILIAVLWVAYSFYSSYQKAQKQKQKRALEAEKPYREDIPEPQVPERDIFRELFETPEIQPKKNPPVPGYQMETTSDSVIPLTEADSMEEIIDDIRIQDRSLVKQPELVMHEEYEATTSESELKNEPAFNLRQAVIYSEILNRKYV